MIQITFNLASVAEAAALFAKLTGTELAAATTMAVGGSADEKAAVVGKPKAERAASPAAAAAAPFPRTAEAAPSSSGQPDAAPATSTGATPPAAAASSAPADKPVAYADLQAAVLKLHKLDPTAAVPIAKGLGFDNFKSMPAERWGEALTAVSSALAARGV